MVKIVADWWWVSLGVWVILVWVSLAGLGWFGGGVVIDDGAGEGCHGW